MKNVLKRFWHQFIADGSINSICEDCFRVVCIRRSEADLEPMEAEHICPEMLSRVTRDYILPGLMSHHYLN